MQGGCGKSTITWESWLSQKENRPKLETIWRGAATKTSNDRLRS